MRMPRTAIALGAAVAMLAGSAAMAATALPIRTTPNFELGGEAATVGGHTQFAWTQAADPNAWGKGWYVMLRTDGGHQQRVSAHDGFSFVGGFDDVTGDLIFQQALPRSSRDSNLVVHHMLGPVAKVNPLVNNPLWQCCADISSGWILYSENKFSSPTALWKVIAFDRATKTKHVLATARYRCYCLDAGNVDGNFASWTQGHSIHVWDLMADTSAGTTAAPSGATDGVGYVVDPDPLTPGDETLYWSRQSRTGCGRLSRILKAPLSDLTNTTTIFAVKAGFFVNSLSVDDTTGTSNLYFGRESCKKVPAGDIFEIKGVETLGPTHAAEPVYVGSGPATRSGASSPEMPRMP